MKKICVLLMIISVIVLSACKEKKKSKVEEITVNGVSFEMVKVEHGKFLMGTPDSQVDSLNPSAAAHERPVHSVTITKDFYMGRYPVTQKLWKAVMGATPVAEGDQWTVDYGLGDDVPAYFVSWTDCQAFISKLNELTGETFRLPTDAEWEYAARGGNKSKGYLYAGSDDIFEVAWFGGFKGAEKVGRKQPNELDLYDMSGNIYEWCGASHDYHQDPYIDPQKTDFSLNTHAIRGGCWNSQPSGCRVSAVGGRADNIRSSVIGLRLVMENE